MQNAQFHQRYHMGYDIIGDIHGQADKLETLLTSPLCQYELRHLSPRDQ